VTSRSQVPSLPARNCLGKKIEKKKVLKAALQLANVDFDKAGSGRS